MRLAGAGIVIWIVLLSVLTLLGLGAKVEAAIDAHFEPASGHEQISPFLQICGFLLGTLVGAAVLASKGSWLAVALQSAGAVAAAMLGAAIFRYAPDFLGATGSLSVAVPLGGMVLTFASAGWIGVLLGRAAELTAGELGDGGPG